MKEKEKKKKSDVIITVVIVLVVIVFVVTLVSVALQLFSGKKNTSIKEDTQKLLDKNLTQYYPQTPTAVVDFYCSLTKQLHSRNVTDEEVEALCKKMRDLFDQELLANNKYEAHLEKLKEEVSNYKSANTVISSYQIEDRDKIKTYVDKEGNDCTKVQIQYSLKSNKVDTEFETVILRKDHDGLWKIYGWETQGSTIKNEEK